MSEGALTTVVVNAYERNPEARRRCIAAHGDACSICGFHFEERYGEIGRGFIHVPHLRELSAARGKHDVDPVKDVRPVCPNCHAMLHRRKPAYSIKELSSLLGDDPLFQMRL